MESFNQRCRQNEDWGFGEFKRVKPSCSILAGRPQELNGPKGRGSRGIPLADANPEGVWLVGI